MSSTPARISRELCGLAAVVAASTGCGAGEADSTVSPDISTPTVTTILGSPPSDPSRTLPLLPEERVVVEFDEVTASGNMVTVRFSTPSEGCASQPDGVDLQVDGDVVFVSPWMRTQPGTRACAPLCDSFEITVAADLPAGAIFEAPHDAVPACSSVVETDPVPTTTTA